MKRNLILEIGKTGSTFDAKSPKGTSFEDIEIGLAQFIIDAAKYRQISSAKFISEIQGWIQQLDERP